MSKKICFISSRPAHILNKRTFNVDWANGRLLKELVDQGHVTSVAIFSDPEPKKSYDFMIEAGNVYPLPFPFSHPGGMMNTFKISQLFRQIEQEHDVLIIQLPIIGFLPLLRIRKPIIFHLCANVLTAAANPFKYKGLKKVLSTSFAQIMHLVFRQLFTRQQVSLIVNGNELGHLYKSFDPVVTVSSSVWRNEIVSENAIVTREEKIFKLLFVGRASMEKGIHILIESFRSLFDEGILIELTLVGVQRHELLTQLITRPLDDWYLKSIKFYSFISWGDEFQAIVKNAHCLVMCSVSEGTPRVIIEAMALGCPVVATDVGGVSTVIQDRVNGLLVPHSDPFALASAIKVLDGDERLRREIALNALRRVSAFSLDSFINVFVEKIKTM